MFEEEVAWISHSHNLGLVSKEKLFYMCFCLHLSATCNIAVLACIYHILYNIFSFVDDLFLDLEEFLKIQVYVLVEFWCLN